MSKAKGSQEEELKIEKVEHALGETEMFIEKNQKTLLIGLGVIIVIVCVILAVRHFYMVPKEQKAQVALFKGETYFAQDSLNLALHGDGKGFDGLLKVADNFSGTASASLANAYIGIIYHQMGDNEQAIKYLKKFDGKDDMVAPAILTTIGDAYTDMEQYDEAISYFEKAAKSESRIVAPISLKKAGLAYEKLGKYDKAIEVYTKIKTKYYDTQEGYEIEKYIQRAETLK